MSTEFDDRYADAYDLLYRDKDYEAECDLIESAFRRHAARPVRDVLDLGCGTGNHAIPLARRGYKVTGVDRSAEMLARAADKARAAISTTAAPRFERGDVREVRLGRTFDAALMMFAVLGYQTSNAQVAAALETARTHLDPGGLFLFDVWYGPAVLSIRPADRLKVLPLEGGQLLRAASGELDSRDQTVQVDYRLWRIERGVVVSETEESHRMRFFFARELEYFLEQAGLELQALTAFPSLDQPPTDATWNVLAVARRR